MGFRMGSWDVRLLMATYKRINNDRDAIVELYGKTKDGKSLIIRDNHFRPYFYILNDEHILKKMIDKEGRIENDGEIVSVETRKLFYNGANSEFKKITIRRPWYVPTLRKMYSSAKFVAADIPYALRFIYDRQLEACIRVEGDAKDPLEIGYRGDILIEAESPEIYGECKPFNPPLKILSFDIENSLKRDDGRIYTIGISIYNNGDMRSWALSGREKDMLEEYHEIVMKEDPDIITGYNIEGYDIPTLLKRESLYDLKSTLPMGRDGRPIKKRGDNLWRATGRVITDAWQAVKKTMKMKQETLSYVAEHVLGDKKIDVDPLKIDEEWKRNKEKVMEYCAHDAELALRILQETKVLQKSMDLAVVSKLPLEDVINGRTSGLIDSILIREADRNGIAVPMTHREKSTSKIAGGYVHTISPGVYHWVCVLDFKSMYPSVIISKNICFTTLNESGDIESPIGVRFLSKKVKEGLLPKILSRLMEERTNIKKKMKDAKEKCDEEAYEYYKGLQEAVKVLMNSFYGVFASTFYRFTNKDIGASITAFARENIKMVIRNLDERGIKVVYSDTDSIFFESPEEGIEKAVEIGRKIAEQFSTSDIVLEFEYVLEPFFSHGRKKRYIGRIVWPTEGTVVRGYEIRRTDSFELQSEALETVLNKILENDVVGAIKYAKEVIKKTLEGKVPVESLIISRSAMDESSYVAKTQAHVRIAKKLKEMGIEFVPGMKVSWIVTDGSKSPQEVVPYISGHPFEGVPDWRYYAERLASTLSRVTEVFQWDERALLSGTEQATLFTSKYTSKKKKKKEKEKSVKYITLDTFM